MDASIALGGSWVLNRDSDDRSSAVRANERALSAGLVAPLMPAPSHGAIPDEAGNITVEAAAPGDAELASAVRTGTTHATLQRTYERGLSFTNPRVGGIGDGSTDNTAAFNSALALLAPSDGELYFPPGAYRIDGTTKPVPGGIWLTGCGYNYNTPDSPTTRPQKHTVIRAGATMARLVQLGDFNADSSAPGKTGASIRGLIIDGNNLAATVVRTMARRNRIMEAQIQDGTVEALHL